MNPVHRSSRETVAPTPPDTSSKHPRFFSFFAAIDRHLQALTTNRRFSEFIGHDPARARTLVPAITLALWLAAFWHLSDQTAHRWMLGWLVIPSLLFVGKELPAMVKSTRWLWIAVALLVWQTLSHNWSGGGNDPPGWWLDSLLVLGLLVAFIAAARGPALAKIVFPALSLLSAITAAINLVIFYLPDVRYFTVHRLRNMFIYEDGLNAVPTGFLFAFGALTAAWLATKATDRWPRVVQTSALTLSLFGLLATQSRGPMLMFAIGMLCLIIFERKRIRRVLVATAATVVVYFGILFMANSGRESSLDLVQRGSTGRFDIYHSFIQSMDVREMLIGTGMGRPPELPEETLGWLVHHPHSVYVTQFYQTGIIGLALLLAVIAVAGKSALTLARRGESLWLGLLAGGCVALVFDGGQIFTTYSTARIEILLIAVPAAIAAGRASNEIHPGIKPKF